jgi:cysteinyl-tRNA synthetase
MDLTALLTLKDALEGATKNTDRMIYKLNQFETRLSVLDQNMSEIQSSTQRYIKAKDNISLTLVEMEKTYEYFRVGNEVKEIINSGYSSTNNKEYLSALIKLSQAKQFFETHREIKSSSSILINIESLITVRSTVSFSFFAFFSFGALFLFLAFLCDVPFSLSFLASKYRL